MWYSSSRVRFHCIWILSNIPAETVASETCQSMQRPLIPTCPCIPSLFKFLRCHTLSLFYCLTVVPYWSLQLCLYKHFCLQITRFVCHVTSAVSNLLFLCCFLILLYAMLRGREKGTTIDLWLFLARYFTCYFT